MPPRFGYGNCGTAGVAVRVLDELGTEMGLQETWHRRKLGAYGSLATDFRRPEAAWKPSGPTRI